MEICTNHQLNKLKCQFCQKILSSKYSCKRHEIVCTKKPSHSPKPAQIYENVVVNYENVVVNNENVVLLHCPNCFKTFASKQNLKIHEYACKHHVGDSLQCTLCDRVFHNRGNLSRHKKICVAKQGQGQGQGQVLRGHEKSLQSLQSLLSLKSSLKPIDNGGHVQIVLNQTNHYHVENHSTTTNNIQINNFGEENKDYLDQTFIEGCLRKALTDGVPRMVEHIHCNPDTPENHNVRITSKKQQLMEVRENNKWNIKDKNDVLDKLIDNSFRILYQAYNAPDSSIKKEDEEKYDNVMLQRLLELSTKLPKIHTPIRRKVFTLLLNLLIAE